MMKFAFYATTSQSGSEGKGDTQTHVGTDRQTNLIGQTWRHTGIETTHLIGLGFSLRRIQLEFLLEK